ncbi:MAG TPA: hypothetical protein VF219_22100 [Vicinamibacterales bacterium]
MSSPNLKLRVSSERFSMTPLPYQVESRCTHGDGCRNRATHRLLSPRDAGVHLLCDEHTLEWADGHGLRVTTARLGDSAA